MTTPTRAERRARALHDAVNASLRVLKHDHMIPVTKVEIIELMATYALNLSIECEIPLDVILEMLRERVLTAVQVEP